MDLHPIFLGPTTPPDLLWFLIHSCTHPTTVIVCSSRSDFLTSLTQSLLSKTHSESDHELQHESVHQTQTDHDRYSLLGAAPLYQMAIARHLRIIFVPTVSHLRACLSVFSPEDSPVHPPPTTISPGANNNSSEGLYGGERGRPPLLLIYGFLEIHRHTSEWTVVGLSNTISILLETANRVGFRAVITEPKGPPPVKEETDIKIEEGLEEDENSKEKEEDEKRISAPENNPLLQSVPFINDGSVRIDLTRAGLGQRTVKVRQVLERWFRFQERGLGEGTRL